MENVTEAPRNTPLSGVYPILATCFHPNDEIDYASQERLIEFCIEGGVHGLVLLANASEGHLMSDEERRELLQFCIDRIGGRVPVVVTVNHPSAKAAAELARFAEASGASAVMAMPPFFGRWRAGPDEISRFFGILNDAVTVPIIVQDHMLSDIQMSVSFLLDLARRWERVRYLKLESGNINYKAKQLAQAEQSPYLGIFGGNSGVFLPEEMESGCTGTMPACYMPEVFRKTWDLMREGRADEAVAYFSPYSR
ncbi:dihydrodipicolinate synthase family protein, partial [Paenibacillus sp.]|uniref:dihydrodipicolinate synthase family protein n=1 Tax=Paenibacillus sp. TaxID=58172 RepID=UPI002D48A63A